MCGRWSPVEAEADDDDGGDDNDDHDDDNAAAAAACPVQRQQQRQTWKLGLVQMEQLHQKSAPVLNSCVLLAFPAVAVAVTAAAAAASSRPPFAVCRWPFFIVPPLPLCAAFFLWPLLFYGKFSKPTRKFATQSARGSGNTKPYDLIRILCSCYRCCFDTLQRRAAQGGL